MPMNKDDCDRCGVTFEAIRMDPDSIVPGKGPERDRELDTIIGNIRKAAKPANADPRLSRRAAHATE